MLNNQNSIKVPGGAIRLSLLKVSGDTCCRLAAVFKQKAHALPPDWLACLHTHAEAQREYGYLAPTVCATMLKIEYYKSYWQGKDGNTPEVTNP